MDSKIMSNDFKRCQIFLEKNGFQRVQNTDQNEFVSYTNGFIGVELAVNESEIVFIDDGGDFLHIKFDYYALVGALIECHQLTMNYNSIKLQTIR